MMASVSAGSVLILATTASITVSIRRRSSVWSMHCSMRLRTSRRGSAAKDDHPIFHHERFPFWPFDVAGDELGTVLGVVPGTVRLVAPVAVHVPARLPVHVVNLVALGSLVPHPSEQNDVELRFGGLLALGAASLSTAQRRTADGHDLVGHELRPCVDQSENRSGGVGNLNLLVFDADARVVARDLLLRLLAEGGDVAAVDSHDAVRLEGDTLAARPTLGLLGLGALLRVGAGHDLHLASPGRGQHLAEVRAAEAEYARVLLEVAPVVDDAPQDQGVGGDRPQDAAQRLLAVGAPGR